MSKIEPLFGCQNDYCRTEVSYPASDLRWWKGGLICYECYYGETGCGDESPHWNDLPVFEIKFSYEEPRDEHTGRETEEKS